MDTNAPRLDIPYADIGKHNLLEEFGQYKEIVCSLSSIQVCLLKSNWDKYENYYLARKRYPGAIVTAFKGVVWLARRSYINFRYEYLEELTQIYTDNANLLEPIEFRTGDDGIISAYFRRKQI